MFQDPHMIYMIAKQKHEELLAEMEKIQKIKSLAKMAPEKSSLLKKMMLSLADLFLAIGVALRRKFGPAPEGVEEVAGDDASP